MLEEEMQRPKTTIPSYLQTYIKLALVPEDRVSLKKCGENSYQLVINIVNIPTHNCNLIKKLEEEVAFDKCSFGIAEYSFECSESQARQIAKELGIVIQKTDMTPPPPKPALSI